MTAEFFYPRMDLLSCKYFSEVTGVLVNNIFMFSQRPMLTVKLWLLSLRINKPENKLNTSQKKI